MANRPVHDTIELVAEFERWTARAREWLPGGAVSVPVADLMTFLDAAQSAMGNLSEGAIYLVWRQWGTCLRALADNPLVMLSAAGDTILSSTLHVLRRAHLTHSEDARCREECELVEDWCAAFVRHLAAGPTHQPSGIDHALAEVRLNLLSTYSQLTLYPHRLSPRTCRTCLTGRCGRGEMCAAPHDRAGGGGRECAEGGAGTGGGATASPY